MRWTGWVFLISLIVLIVGIILLAVGYSQPADSSNRKGLLLGGWALVGVAVVMMIIALIGWAYQSYNTQKSTTEIYRLRSGMPSSL